MCEYGEGFVEQPFVFSGRLRGKLQSGFKLYSYGNLIIYVHVGVSTCAVVTQRRSDRHRRGAAQVISL